MSDLTEDDKRRLLAIFEGCRDAESTATDALRPEDAEPLIIAALAASVRHWVCYSQDSPAVVRLLLRAVSEGMEDWAS